MIRLSSMQKEALPGALSPAHPDAAENTTDTVSPQDMAKFYGGDLLKTPPNQGGEADNSGHMETFLHEVGQALNRFKEAIRQNGQLNQLDQSLLSIIDNFNYELSGSVTADRVDSVFFDVFDELRNNGSRYANKVFQVLKKLHSNFEQFFIGKTEEMPSKPVLISMVREAEGGFGYRPDDGVVQSTPVNSEAMPSGGNYQDKVQDSKILEKNTSTPEFPNITSDSMQASERLRHLTSEVFKHLSSARAGAYTVYTQALDFKGDVDSKSDLISSSDKLTRKIDQVLDLIQSINFKINRMK